ncbi:DUF977 family protein [Salmonella enterica subsp. enterica serovar Brandenburg]|uniref:DUF977 family protein n=1 Tax=Salmonella enterica TaxID=28901 RepID=UPI0009AF92EA|nr:DUF977 family protein [Salmonella enterica]EAB6122472.1 DUF977 family protein [Salmonella enterica subsp. enterica serovar Braenderup]EAB9752351.1 DUF977 family protein [Salmonella enterica subsp. salamae]EAC0468689.1 DUF977 family protein [Salmonella enterica subsp. enterica serovar Newport]ECC3678011.1 DUF977 family protein [Salmonella enterica subsp. enterica serovar Miami]ECD3769643.1 DUF977 family protein [Salmonella enterica subsp. enterica serovar Onderstepoort]ECI2686036.1 DUF977 f
MSKNYTPEKREEIQRRITELVRKHGRMTLTGLRRMTGLTMYSTRRYLDKAERCGDVYQAGRGGGIFPSEEAYRAWKKQAKADAGLIWKLPDGEIRRYDRHHNVICRECRKSEYMQRVLAFYRGNNGAVKTI